MLAADPDHRPPSRQPCPVCGGTAGGCRGLAFLSGRPCCDQCTGDHDAAAEVVADAQA